MSLNVDVSTIGLFKDKTKLINIGLIILALIIAKNIYGSQIAKVKLLKADKEMELKKNTLIGEIGKIEKKAQAYKKVLFKRDTSSVINDFTEMANSAQIKITSIIPEKEKEFAAYREISVRLSILVPDYHHLGDFISRLESSPGFYLIDNLTIQPALSQEGDSSDKLSSDMSVVAVVFKD